MCLFLCRGLGWGNYSVTEVIDDERFASGLNVGPKQGILTVPPRVYIRMISFCAVFFMPLEINFGFNG